MEAVGSTMCFGRRQFGQEEQVDSPNLRDFLRINEDGSNRGNFPGQTLDSILSLERDRGPTRVRSNRTLLDIIRDDPIHNNDNRKSWRHRLLVLLQGSVSGSSVPSSSNNNPIPESTRLNPSTSVGSDPSQAASNSSEIIRNASGETTAVMEGSTGEQPARMSLMALLEETDRHLGFDGSCFVMEVEEGKEEEVAEKGGGGEHSCCVCMVRRKGAAFIPCGHTFCRLCCRELWVQRGNCPLCNSLILEILDIF